MYHGSPVRLDILRAGSWVTPFREDAAVFGVPWDSRELADRTAGPRNGWFFTAGPRRTTRSTSML